MTFRIESLAAHHARATFTCGSPALDTYFRQQASQDMRKRSAACFVAVDSLSEKLAGFYTLSAGSVALGELPPALIRQLPRYPAVPVARLGRLAISLDFQGQKLGAALLWDAIQRSATSELMAYAVIVDAKDERAEAFYAHHGFIRLPSLERQLILPLKGISNL